MAGLALWAALPFLIGERMSLSVFVLIALYTPVVVGLSLLAGYTGQVSLGQAAFYGLGAYTTGVLSARFGWSPWASMPVAVLATALVAFLVGRPILMLRGHYLVVATLGLNIIVEVLMRELYGLTGGPSGLTGVPPLALGDLRLGGDLFYYYAAGALALLAMGTASNLVRSRVGRALQAIQASETAAETLGIDPARYKARVFAWSAALAAAPGALYAHYVNYVSPSPFGFGFSVELLMMTVIGGIASIPGAAFGAAVTVLLREQLRNLISGFTGGSGAEYEIVVYGLLLAVIMIYAPEGLWSRLSGRFVPVPAREEREASATASSNPAASSAAVPASVPASAPAETVPGSAASRARASDTVPVLEVHGLTRRFGGLTAVRELSFRVGPGEVFAIIGPNGAGKTTLFNLVSGVLTPSAGSIHLAGQRVTGLPAHRIAELGVARTFQTPRLIPHLSVLDNVRVGLHRHLRAGFPASALRLAEGEERAATRQALAALEMVGIADLAHQPAGSLPFGAQRLVELARALVSRPRLLLLDEPASGLTAAERRFLAGLIRQIRAAGISVILVEHDVPLVMEVADRILVLHHGEPIAEGDPNTVRNDPRVISAYLGVRGADEFHEPAASPPVRSGGGGEPLLRVRDIEAGYGTVRVLHGAGFEVRAGEVVSIVGPNGAGKSTLMRVVAGLLPARGEVSFAGRSILGVPAERIASLGLGLVPERRQLLWTMSVRDHLLLGAYPRLRRDGRQAVEADLNRVFELFPVLRDRLPQAASSLSGGQQQMLAIARALMARPRVLLLDEPLLGLAPQVVDDILATVRRLREAGLGIVLVEQNAAAVLPVADRVYVMEGGRLTEVDAADPREATRLEAAFLGAVTQDVGEGVRGSEG
ncbi:MAG: ATP-binding cassette domain-containing protein [Bacillota bacterium]